MSGEKELKGLGGWLILVGIGVVIGPIRLLAVFIPLYFPMFSDGTWAALTTPSSAVYTPYFGAMLIAEMCFNSLMLLACLFLVFLFFTKNHLFPKVYIGIIAASLIFIPLDAWVVTAVFPDQSMFDPDTLKEFGRTLIAAVIWVPYMLVSKRVKATFVEGRPEEAVIEHDDDNQPGEITA